MNYIRHLTAPGWNISRVADEVRIRFIDEPKLRWWRMVLINAKAFWKGSATHLDSLYRDGSQFFPFSRD
ncbi:hypothetical protein MnTg04_01692 [bacterium MnTg04]|nr:hypothetical protein MnTg04_01692 [bacterium MnTg04]